MYNSRYNGLNKLRATRVFFVINNHNNLSNIFSLKDILKRISYLKVSHIIIIELWYYVIISFLKYHLPGVFAFSIIESK